MAYTPKLTPEQRGDFERRRKEVADNPDALRALYDSDLAAEYRKNLAGGIAYKSEAPITARDALCASLTAVAWLTDELGVERSRMRTLEKRIAELEARPELKYLGVWNAQKQYAMGNLVTFRGSMWHCNSQTHGLPGPGECSHWTLCVKRGADAK